MNEMYFEYMHMSTWIQQVAHDVPEKKINNLTPRRATAMPLNIKYAARMTPNYSTVKLVQHIFFFFLANPIEEIMNSSQMTFH